MRKFLKRVIRLSHRFLVKLYINMIGIGKYVEWMMFLKKKDVKVLNEMNEVVSVKPIHKQNWHFGTRFINAQLKDKQVFVKVLSNKQLADREINFYNNLQMTENAKLRRFIPQYVMSRETKEYVYILLEYIEGKSFEDLEINDYSIDERMAICSALLSVLEGLLEIGYAHNDIRLSNFMLRDGIPVLFDFGYACKISEINNMLCSLSHDERHQLNEYNRIEYDKHNDAFSMYYVMKYINPSLLSNQTYIWQRINQLISDL